MTDKDLVQENERLRQKIQDLLAELQRCYARQSDLWKQITQND